MRTGNQGTGTGPAEADDGVQGGRAVGDGVQEARGVPARAGPSVWPSPCW